MRNRNRASAGKKVGQGAFGFQGSFHVRLARRRDARQADIRLRLFQEKKAAWAAKLEQSRRNKWYRRLWRWFMGEQDTNRRTK